MSKKSAIAQIFSVNKSPLLVRFLIIIHSLAAVASLANALFWLYKTVILVAVGISLFCYLRHYHFQFQPCRIRHNEDSSWSVITQNDVFQVMQVLTSSVITAWLIVLHFRLENGKFQSLIILNDALNEHDYRALAVTLKIAGFLCDDA